MKKIILFVFILTLFPLTPQARLLDSDYAQISAALDEAEKNEDAFSLPHSTVLRDMENALLKEAEGTRAEKFVNTAIAGKRGSFVTTKSVSPEKEARIFMHYDFHSTNGAIIIKKSDIEKFAKMRPHAYRRELICIAPLLVHEAFHGSTDAELTARGLSPTVNDIKEEEVAFMETFIFIQEKMNQKTSQYYSSCKGNPFARKAFLREFKSGGFQHLRKSVAGWYFGAADNLTKKGIAQLVSSPSFDREQKSVLEGLKELPVGETFLGVPSEMMENMGNIISFLDSDGTLSEKNFFTQRITAKPIIINKEDLTKMAEGESAYFNSFLEWRDKRFNETLAYYQKVFLKF